MRDEAVRTRFPSDSRSRARPALRVAALLAPLLLLAAAAHAADSASSGAEALVRRVYYEGVPYGAARSVDDAGAARLAAMLLDPGEREWWPNIALVLGIAGRSGAYEALCGASEAGGSGELDRPAYKLQTAIPLAMGHLARSDPRALAWLAARAREPASDPGWSFRSQRGAELGAQLRGLALVGLGLSGRPEARPLLEALAADPSELGAGADEALRLHARIAAEGPDAVLGAKDRE